ncbi:MAG TPA: hypothetical protein VJB94_04800 [Candidatus Nanoarchaeia archaeon]|nr:hypothetical protein [Candidatus Nanoarchaeia archaeon]
MTETKEVLEQEKTEKKRRIILGLKELDDEALAKLGDAIYVRLSGAGRDIYAEAKSSKKFEFGNTKGFTIDCIDNCHSTEYSVYYDNYNEFIDRLVRKNNGEIVYNTLIVHGAQFSTRIASAIKTLERRID